MRILMAAAAFILCASLIPAQVQALRALPQGGEGAADRIAPRERVPVPEPAPGYEPEPKPAPVEQPPVVALPPVETGFVCTPGFTLVKNDTGYRLSGTLETPTPGYAYEIGEVEEAETGVATGVMHLTGPGGVVTQVIDSIQVNYDYASESDLTRFTLSIEKQFNWGPGNITCSYVAPEEGETE